MGIKVISTYLNKECFNRRMDKNNFLLVDLNDTKTKKLAETITSETSRKILNHLAEKDASEANLAQGLSLPISTVHYHLQKLQEVGLVKVEEFHYSQKGREVNHYKLANKYIIIAPQRVSGLKEKLKGILPVGLVIAGISGALAIVQLFTQKVSLAASSKVADAESVMLRAAPVAEEPVRTVAQYSWYHASLWFLVGGVSAILIYIIYQWIRSKVKKDNFIF